MVAIHRLSISPSLVNASCPWASDLEQLNALYACPRTGAVVTRTATLKGFSEDSRHTVAFTRDTVSSLNSYGYSPHPLSQYIAWVRAILRAEPTSTTKPTSTPAGNCKPFIISITASSSETLSEMIEQIQSLRAELGDHDLHRPSRIGIELNTSCPNIPTAPPPSYSPLSASFETLLQPLATAFSADPTLTIGLKLPPYVYANQFDQLLEAVSKFNVDRNRLSLAGQELGGAISPFAFFTCTNTLGNSLLYDDQTILTNQSPAQSQNVARLALPVALGGLAGEHLHSLSLGNVYTFSQKLASLPPSDPLKDIVIIGVGGVTSDLAARRMRRAGARVVGCATLLGREGVHAFEQLAVEESL